MQEVFAQASKASEFIAKGEVDNAIAYAMAAGYRMGWNACKKKIESI